MTRLLMTPQALAEMATMPPGEQGLIRQALKHLAQGRISGIKLWGQEELFMAETTSGGRLIYQPMADHIEVLGISAGAPAPAPPERHMRLAAVVLAAGHGDCGATMPLGMLADSFLSAGIDDLIMVVGEHADAARLELARKDVTLVINPEYDNGLAYSLRYGLKMLSPNTRAVLLSPGNRPFITTKIITSLIRAFKTQGSSIIVPAHDQMRGHPVLFDTCLVPELMRAQGSCGGRGVLAHHQREMTQIEIADAGVLEKVWTN